MPVLPQFSPAAGPGAIPAAVNAGITTGMSMMERGQVARLREEQIKQAQHQRIEDELTAPLRAAETRAKLTAFQSGLANAEKNEQMMAAFAQDSQTAEDEWISVMSIGDPEAQARGAMEWTGRWMRYAPVKGFDELWNSRKEIAGKFTQHAFDMRKLRQEFDNNVQMEGVKAKNAPPQSPLGKLLADFNAANSAGRAEEAEYYKAQIDADITPKGMRMEVGPDGRIIFAQGAGALTTGVTGQSQQSQFQAERAIREGAQLLVNLRPEDVGVRGVVQDEFVNKALGQINPGLVDEAAAANRASLATWREGMLRLVSSDTRFSNADRSAIEKLLPSSGILESLPSARAKMLAVIHILKGRAEAEADRRGTNSIVGMKPDELVAAGKAGEVEPSVAAALLLALHPDWVEANKPKPKTP